MLGNRHVVFSLVLLMMGAFNITYWMSYIELRLQYLGLQEINVGWVLGSTSIVYIINCLMYPLLFNKLPRKLQFQICLLGFAIVCILMGPSKFIGLPEELWILICSFPVIGLF